MAFDPKEYKPGLLQPVDMSKLEIRTAGRTVKPFDGEQVWLEPYMEAGQALKLDTARMELGEDPSNEEQFGVICRTLASLILGWNLTDKKGEPLPQPSDDSDVLMRLPNDAVLFLLQEALGVEPPPKGKKG